MKKVSEIIWVVGVSYVDDMNDRDLRNNLKLLGDKNNCHCVMNCCYNIPSKQTRFKKNTIL